MDYFCRWDHPWLCDRGETLNMEWPKLNTIYRHFNGCEYITMLIATDTRDGQKLVVYQKRYYEPDEEFEEYARPLSEWFEHVERDGYSGPRFVEDEWRAFNA